MVAQAQGENIFAESGLAPYFLPTGFRRVFGGLVQHVTGDAALSIAISRLAGRRTQSIVSTREVASVDKLIALSNKI